MTSIIPNKPINVTPNNTAKLDLEADKREAKIAKNFSRGAEQVHSSTSAQSQLSEATDGDSSEATATAGQRSTNNDGSSRREIFGAALDNYKDIRPSDSTSSEDQGQQDGNDDDALQNLRQTSKSSVQTEIKTERVDTVENAKPQSTVHEDLMRASGTLDKASLSTFTLGNVYKNLQSILDSNDWKQSSVSDKSINAQQMYPKD